VDIVNTVEPSGEREASPLRSVPENGVFKTTRDIVVALRRVKDSYEPRTSSLLLLGRTPYDPGSEPFRAGFLQRIEERQELIRLLGSLDERSRQLMLLWFVEELPVADIARRLDISRVHCYRLKDGALRAMLESSRSRMGGTGGRKAQRRLLALVD
jgi:DNA-directed RNA polymerase specialized sigma24 family protein